MTDDARLAAIAARARAELSEQRRMAAPEDYVYDKAQDAFWDVQDCTMHKAPSVDASIPQTHWRVEVTEPETPRGRRRERLIKPSLDIMRVEADQFVEASTWWPGQPQLIRDWLVGPEGRWRAPGRRLFNTYRPPDPARGNAANAERWAAHVRRLWPDPTEHNYFFDYCAHMVQRPEEKCNAAIILSGTQGIGKDAALQPVKRAVGDWNTQGIDPNELFSPYRPWLQTLMLVIDEARASKDEYHASSMYNILKPLIAAPPDTLALNDKFKNMRHVVNCMRVFITTNDRMAMFIPEEDRRYFIMHSPLRIDWFLEEHGPSYFNDLFGWFAAGGTEDVAAWLASRDLQHFNPKAPPAKTDSWAAVVGSWGMGEDDPIDGAIEALGRPTVVFSSELAAVQFDGREEVVALVKSPRKLQHRMERAGYLVVPRPRDQDRWRSKPGAPLFRSRMAFVRDAPELTAPGAALEAVLAAIDTRAREAGTALKPKLVSRPQV